MAKYNHNESLTENAMRGVDITEPEEEAEEFKRFMDEIGDDLQRAISEIKELEEQ